MNGNAEQVNVDMLILKPSFSKAETFEDIKDLLSLYEFDIMVDVNSTKPEWLEKISAMERKGLISVAHDEPEN